MGRGPRNPGCGCCEQDCIDFTDDFDRADDTDLGSDWDERAGNWEISSEQLTVSTADALVICDTCTVSGDQTLWSYYEMDTTGDKIRFILSYVDDDNYVAVEIESGDPCDTVRCIVRDTAVETQYGDDQFTYGSNNPQSGVTRQAFAICLDKTTRVLKWQHDTTLGTLVARDRNGSGQFTLPSGFPDGSKSGLGTGDTLTGTISFTDASSDSGNSLGDSTSFNCGSLRDHPHLEEGCIVCEPCEIFQQGNHVGAGWTSTPGTGSGFEVSTGTAGHWSTNGSGITEALRYAPGSAQTSLILTKFDQPAGHEEMIVGLGYQLLVDSAAVRIVVNAVDSNNYHYAEITRATGSGTRLELGKRSSGVDTTLASTSFAQTLNTVNPQASFVCFGGGKIAIAHLTAGSSFLGTGFAATDGETIAVGDFYLEAETTEHASGLLAGFLADAPGAAAAVDVHDFTWEHHHINRAKCLRCCTRGSDQSIRQCSSNPTVYLQVEFTNTSFDGTYVAVWQPAVNPIAADVWRWSANGAWLEVAIIFFGPNEGKISVRYVDPGTASEFWFSNEARETWDCENLTLQISKDSKHVRLSPIGSCGTN